MEEDKLKLSLSLRAVSLLGKKDAYAKVTWRRNDHEEKFLGQTEVIKDTQDPKWSEAFIFDHKFGERTSIIVDLFQEGNPNDTIGCAQFDVNTILGNKCNYVKTISDGGFLHVRLDEIKEAPSSSSFLDYINGGCKVSVIVAIDFTGSNGDPRKKGTLHYLHHPDGNDYEKAIKSAVGVLSAYDSDQMYPVWGFGAKFDEVLSNCFQCGSREEVHGIDGIIQAYRETFNSKMKMSKPSDITEVIAKAAKVAKELNEGDKQSFTILLILTDGGITDVPKTNNTLDSVCDAPLSVIIVGIGEDEKSNFVGMKNLDDHTEGTTKRDICDFIKFNDHKGDMYSLTAAILGEFPSHLTNYFKSKKIKPLQAKQLTEDDSNQMQLRAAKSHVSDGYVIDQEMLRKILSTLEGLGQMNKQLVEIKEEVIEVKNQQMDLFIKTVNREGVCPRLFILVTDASDQKIFNLSTTYRLYFLCDHDYSLVKTKIVIKDPKIWMRQIAPLLHIVAFSLRALCVACAGVPIPFDGIITELTGMDSWDKVANQMLGTLSQVTASLVPGQPLLRSISIDRSTGRSEIPAEAYAVLVNEANKPENVGWKNEMELVSRGNVFAWVKKENIEAWKKVKNL